MIRIEISNVKDSKLWAEIHNKLYGKVMVSFDGIDSNSVSSKTYDVYGYDKDYFKSIGAKVKEIKTTDMVRKLSAEVKAAKINFDNAQKQLTDLEREFENYNIATIDYIFSLYLGEYLDGKKQSKLYNEIKAHNTGNKKLHDLLKQLHWKYKYEDKCLVIMGK